MGIPTVYMPIESPEEGGLITLDIQIGTQAKDLLVVANQRTKRIIDVVLTAMTQVVVGVGGTSILIKDLLDPNPVTNTLCTFVIPAGTYAANHRWMIGKGDANPAANWQDARGVVVVSPRTLTAQWLTDAGHSGWVACKVIHQTADGGHEIAEL